MECSICVIFSPYNEGLIQLRQNVFEKREYIPDNNGGIYAMHPGCEAQIVSEQIRYSFVISITYVT